MRAATVPIMLVVLLVFSFRCALTIAALTGASP